MPLFSQISLFLELSYATQQKLHGEYSDSNISCLIHINSESFIEDNYLIVSGELK